MSAAQVEEAIMSDMERQTERHFERHPELVPEGGIEVEATGTYKIVNSVIEVVDTMVRKYAIEYTAVDGAHLRPDRL